MGTCTGAEGDRLWRGGVGTCVGRGDDFGCCEDDESCIDSAGGGADDLIASGGISPPRSIE